MTKALITLLLAISLSFLFSCATGHTSGEVIASEGIVLLVNADIVTMNPGKPSADALAVC
jgi:hypothetical protein